MGHKHRLVSGFLFLVIGALIVLGLGVAALPQYAFAASQTKKIVFVEIVQNGAFDAMVEGFKERMGELGYKDVVYDIKNAQGDMSTMHQIANQLKTENADLIVPIATPSAQAVVNAKLQTPSVFISVTDPIGAGLMESFDKPTHNITGTSNKTPVDEIYELGEQLVPSLASGKLGILYCAGEKNSQVSVDEMVDYLKKRGRSYEIKAIANSSEAQQAAAALASSCSAIFVPMDSVVQSAMVQVTETAAQNSVPVLGSDPIMVHDGALLSVACGNKTIGRYSAELAFKILEGTPIQNVAALNVADNDRVVSKSQLEAFGLNAASIPNLMIVDKEGQVIQETAQGTQAANAAQETSDKSVQDGVQLISLVQDAVLLGLEYGLLALGVYISFRILDIPDLTCDGTFCLGMATSAVLTVAGYPILGLLAGTIAGSLAGSCTGGLIVKGGINPLLAGIITMTGLYSINTFVLGGPNVSLIGIDRLYDGVAQVFSVSPVVAQFILIVAVDVAVIAGLALYFKTESGLSMRACGNNEQMCRASSINTDRVKVAGLALSNALIGLAGALIAQYQGFADVSSGTGMVMIGLASVIIGEVLSGKCSVLKGLVMSVVGSIIYRIAIQAALQINLLDPAALKLITALIVGGFMGMPALRQRLARRRVLATRKDLNVSDTYADVASEVDCVHDCNISSMGAKPALMLSDISKTFYAHTPMENTVLKGLNLELEPGDFACVVGSNGAGKSTMFNIIAGALIADTGRVAICGKDCTFTPDFKRARSLSRVFQDPSLGTAPDLTVAENIALAYGKSKKTDLAFAMRREVREFIYSELKSLGFGLEDRMDVAVGMLSGGQRQAVTLLMATIGNPDLLLLDEHTAALDPEAQRRILELTERICTEKQITTLMITHDLQAALTCGNKTLVMDEGRIVEVLEKQTRKHLGISGLMEIFKQKTGKALSDEALLSQRD